MVAVRILGIDPGTVVVGFACLEIVERVRDRADDAARRPLAQRAGNVVRASLAGGGGGLGGGGCTLLEAGALRLGRTTSVPARLHQLADFVDELLQRLMPHELAIEEAFFGKSVQSALRVGEARGVVLASAHRRGVVIHQYPPARIKRAVTGSGVASKEAVASFAARQVGRASIDGPRDVSDALATALCRFEERRGLDSLLPASASPGKRRANRWPDPDALVR